MGGDMIDIRIGHAMDELGKIEDGCAQCVVTSVIEFLGAVPEFRAAGDVFIGKTEIRYLARGAVFVREVAMAEDFGFVGPGFRLELAVFKYEFSIGPLDYEERQDSLQDVFGRGIGRL